MSRFIRLSSFAFALISLGLSSGAAQALPDVSITFMKTIPTNPVAGQSVIIQASIGNFGTTDTPNNVAVGSGIQVDGVHTGSFFVRQNLDGTGPAVPLEVGHVYPGVATPNWIATPGTHTICAFADDINRFVESDEGNNSRCISLTVPPSTVLPDVTVTDLYLIPSVPAPSQSAIVVVGIKNIGSAPTPTGIPVGSGVQVDGAHIGSFFVRDHNTQQTVPLDIGEYYGNDDIRWTATPGTHQICAFVDDIDRFAEDNENNNSDCITVTVAQGLLPDLEIGAITLNPANPTAGQSVEVATWVLNNGNADTPTGIAVGTGVHVDGAYLDAFFARDIHGNLDTITVNQFYRGTVNWTATSGKHSICSYADDIDRFAELDENNNSDCITFVVP